MTMVLANCYIISILCTSVYLLKIIYILLNLYSCLCNFIPEHNLQNLGNISRIFLGRIYSLNSGGNVIEILIC